MQKQNGIKGSFAIETMVTVLYMRLHEFVKAGWLHSGSESRARQTDRPGLQRNGFLRSLAACNHGLWGSVSEAAFLQLEQWKKFKCCFPAWLTKSSRKQNNKRSTIALTA